MKNLSQKLITAALSAGMLVTLGAGMAEAHPRTYQHHHGHQSWYRHDNGRVHHTRDNRAYRNDYYYQDRDDRYYRDRRYRRYDDETGVRIDLDNDRYYDRDADLEIGPLDINF